MIHLIDSSIWLDFLNKKSDIELTQRVQELMKNKQAAWCPMIQLELERSGKERASALALLNEVLPSLEINQAVWSLAHQLGPSLFSQRQTNSQHRHPHLRNRPTPRLSGLPQRQTLRLARGNRSQVIPDSKLAITYQYIMIC